MAGQKITTAAELDALPVGSVVMEGPSGEPVDGFFGIKVMPGVFHRFPGGWYVVAGHGARMPEFDLGPLTTLYRPDAEPERLVFPDEDAVAGIILDHFSDKGHGYRLDAHTAARAVLALGSTEAEVRARAFRESAHQR